MRCEAGTSAGWTRSSTPVFPPPRHAQQLDAVAQLLGAGHIHPLQRRDAFHLHVIEAHRRAERIGGQQRELVRGVDALYVESRVGFRVAQRLGLGERGAEVQAFIAHLAQNEVGGAVDDARHPFDAIGREPFAQRLDDGNAHRHRTLVGHGHAMLPGRRKNFGAVHRQQGLVGGDHMLAMGNGGQHPVACRAGTAGNFDHHVDVGVCGNAQRVVRQRNVPAHDGGGPRQVARRDHHHLDRPPGAAGNLGLVAGQHAKRARADGANADHAHAQCVGSRAAAGQGFE